MKKIKVNRINVITALIATVHFLITFFTDKNIFNLNNINKLNYSLCKILLFVILLLFWNFIIKLIIKKDKNKRMYIKYFLVYMIPMIIILLLIWPGVWYGSDVTNFFWISTGAEYLYYLNYMTSVFYIVGYMLFPVPSGAIILQTILYGIVCSYIIKNCFDIYKSKWIYLMYLPFFLLHTIFYTFYANRPIMYSAFYLLIVMYMIFEYKKKKKYNIKKILFLSIITAIAGFWRSESIYLIICIPILTFIIYHLKVNVKNIITIFGIFILSFTIISLPQKIEEHKESTDAPSSRNLPIFVGPLSYMLSQGNLVGKNLEYNLSNIDKVIDVEIMTKYGSYADTPAIWSDGGCIKEYTKEEYDLFLKSYIEVIKDNFPLFLKTKTYTFAASSGVFNEGFTSINLYTKDSDLLFGRKDTKALFGNKIRKNTMKFIEGKFNNNGKLNIIYRLFGNLLWPMIFIGMLFIYAIKKKNIFYFLISGMMIGHICIVFFTAPASYFMYYYNIYLCGWVLAIYFLISFLEKNYNTIKNSKKSSSK